MKDEDDHPTLTSDVSEDAGGIWPVMFSSTNAISSIAPEREAELINLLKGLTLHLADSNKFSPSYIPTRNIIILPRAFVESLWCTSYVYHLLCIRLAKGLIPGIKFEIYLGQDNELQKGFILLDRCIKSVRKNRKIDWSSCPTPVAPIIPTPKSTPIEIAGELSLCAIGFVLLHELAHKALKHTAGKGRQRTLEQEKEADSWAIDWILNKVEFHDEAKKKLMITKRAWGIVIATSLIIAVQMPTLNVSGQRSYLETSDHPLPYDRLDKAIQHNSIQEDKLIKETMLSLACVPLVLHIKAYNLKFPDTPYDNYEALYNECLNVLAERYINLK